MKQYNFKLWQNGVVVAEGEGPDKDYVEGEGWHYAKVYAQDGPVMLQFSFRPRRAKDDGNEQES